MRSELLDLVAQAPVMAAANARRQRQAEARGPRRPAPRRELQVSAVAEPEEPRGRSVGHARRPAAASPRCRGRRWGACEGLSGLLAALGHLRGQIRNLHLVIFGQLAPRQPSELGFPVHYTGHLHDDLSLRTLYSAADVLVVPSRQDNLPNTGIEAHACATPVVAFDTGGLPDIVEHQRTGYLARAFDTRDLAAGILWVLNHAQRARLGEQARTRAVARFSYPVVAERYREVYRQVAGA